MASPLSWVFKLVDNLSGPANKASNALDHHADSAHKAGDAVDKLGQSHREAGEHAEGFRHKLFEWMEIGHRAYEVAEMLGDKIGEMFKAAAGEERRRFSIKAILGGEEGAETLEYLEQLGKHTEFTGAELQNLTIALSNAGIKAEGLKPAMAAVADMTAIMGGGFDKAAESVAVLERLSMGDVAPRQLRRIGISIHEFYKALGQGASEKSVKAGLAAQQYDPETLQQTLYGLITKKTGKDLGSTGKEASTTMDALMHKLKAFPEMFAESLAGGKAFSAFNNVLTMLAKSFEPGGAFGRKVSEALDDIVEGLFGDFFKDLTGPGGMQKLQDRALLFLKSVKDAIPEIKAAFAEVKDVITSIAAALWDLTEKVLPKLGAILRGAATGAVEGGVVGAVAGPLGIAGTATLGAVIGGYHGYATDDFGGGSGADNPYRKKGAEAGEAFELGYRDALEIHSPSKVMQRLGELSADGFQIGLSGGRVNGPSITTGGGSGWSGDMHINVTTQATDAAAVGHEVAAQVRAEIANYFDGLAVQAA